MPNAFAYIVVFSWPLVVVALFWKLSLPRALVASILGGYLLLPERVSIDLPVLPPFDKTLMPSLAAAIMCLLLARRAVPARPSHLEMKELSSGMSNDYRLALVHGSTLVRIGTAIFGTRNPASL